MPGIAIETEDTGRAPALRPSTEVVLRLVDVAKSFGDVRAVDGISLDINAGEFRDLRIGFAAGDGAKDIVTRGMGVVVHPR